MTGLDRLVEGIFDYAGLFPPAALEFDAALKVSAEAPGRLARPRLVGADFVLDFPRLASLSSERLLERGFPKAKTVRIAVLGTAIDDPDPVEAARQIEAIARFNEEGAFDPVRRRVVSYEIKLKLDGFAVRDNAWIAVDRARRELGALPVRLFVEPEWDDAAWKDRLDWFCGGLDSLNADPALGAVCLKLRGSGPTAISPERLSELIGFVNARSLPLKATAGLHHPLVEQERFANTMGFLGLAAALRLQRSLGEEVFSRDRVLACLRETNPAAFSFEDGLAWTDFKMTAAQLEDAVLSHPFGIGSCSLEEPDADLTRLFPDIAPAAI